MRTGSKSLSKRQASEPGQKRAINLVSGLKKLGLEGLKPLKRCVAQNLLARRWTIFAHVPEIRLGCERGKPIESSSLVVPRMIDVESPDGRRVSQEIEYVPLIEVAQGTSRPWMVFLECLRLLDDLRIATMTAAPQRRAS